MENQMKKRVLLPLFFCSASALSATSANITLTSDYLFNGVSQTQEDPALQAGLDWSAESGFYVGMWGSNVDFGDGTDIELDAYLGYAFDVNDNISLDVGMAMYTYHGGDDSSDINYPEGYVKVSFGNTSFNYWYSWDYAGTDAAHSIIMITHTIPVNEQWSIDLGFDHSSSHAKYKFSWEENDKSYAHWKVAANYNLSDWVLSLGYEGTDLKTYGDDTIVFSVSRGFEF